MAFQSAVLFALLTVSKLGLAIQDFTYDGLHGPSHWGEDYNTCVGKHQSPINIQEHIVRNVSLQPLKFFGLDQSRRTFITNNGHTVMLQMNDSDSAQIRGGPLGNSDYVFEQLHFHWGENDGEGSEDMINNHSFAMELHAVFWKKSYGSMGAAVNNADGLAVLAYFFEVSDEDNPEYEAIVAALPKIEGLGTKFQLDNALIIEPILVPKIPIMENYFTYNGSLTTPPCSEVVTWIDFKDPLPVSHKQIAAFRDVRSTEGQKLTHNFRPVQPLEDRIVYYNTVYEKSQNSEKSVESNTIENANSGQFKIDGSAIPAAAAILLTVRSVFTFMLLDDFR